MRTTIFPMNSMHLKPSFWGIDRDLKGILEDMEGLWDGNHSKLSFSNITETDQAYMTTVDIPGINKANLDIQVEENHIRVEGTRSHQLMSNSNDDEKEEKTSRLVVIPKDVDKDKIQAHCEDGVLYLALPKLEKEKPKKVEVSTGKRNTKWDKLLGEKKRELQ